MPIVIYRSWRDFPLDKWRWTHFSPEEMACRGTGQLLIDEPSLDKLQALRELLGKPIIVNSAYRSPSHNKKVGGKKGSYHLRAMAYDCSMANHDPVPFEAAARAVGFTGFGFYPERRNNFMHIDTGPARVWGKRFPPRPVTVSVETVAEGDEAEAEADRFAPEPAMPTVLESLIKPEVVTTVGSAGVSGFLLTIGDLLKTSLPLQIAVSVLLVGVPIGVAIWLIRRNRRVRAGD